jgi:hypothetical protein
MRTPSNDSTVEKMYLIDRLKDGNVWYLWTAVNGQWVVLKTGDWGTIIKKLAEMKEGE